MDAVSINSANGKGKLRLLQRDHLDQRTSAFKHYDSIVKGLINDYGPEDKLTTKDMLVFEAVAGAAVRLREENAKAIIGEGDLLAHCQAITTLTRVASRLPDERSQRDVTPSLSDYLNKYEVAK